MKALFWLALLALLLAGCSLPAALDDNAAQRRWQARPITHYLLRTTDIIGGITCEQSVEVRGEQLIQILGNTCQHPNLWTVSWLFHHASSARNPIDRCTLRDPAAGCLCRSATAVQVEYDPVHGFPRTIVVQQTWRANWQGAGYWLYTAQHIALPSCAPPVASPSSRVVVRELKLLP